MREIRPRVLAGDDDDGVLFVYRMTLELDGFDVSSVRDGRELIDLARTGPRPDVIVLDARMPKMDGWDCLRELKRDQRLASVPVVMVTGSLDDTERTRALGLGAAGWVNKPFCPDELSELLWTLVEMDWPGGQLAGGW